MNTLFTTVLSDIEPIKVVLPKHVNTVYGALGGVYTKINRKISFTGSLSAGDNSTSDDYGTAFGKNNVAGLNSLVVGTNGNVYTDRSFVISDNNISQWTSYVRNTVTFGGDEVITIPTKPDCTSNLIVRIMASDFARTGQWESSAYEFSMLVVADGDNVVSIIDIDKRWDKTFLIPTYDNNVSVDFDIQSGELVLLLSDSRSTIETGLHWTIHIDSTEVDYK